MSNEIRMPALSPTMTEGVLSRWLVKKGDEIRSGDVIAEIETDKATMEVEAVEDGVVTQLMVDEGTTSVLVGTVIATFQTHNEERIPSVEDKLHTENIKSKSNADAKKTQVN